MSAVGIINPPDWAQVDNVKRNISDSCLALYGANWAEEMLTESTFSPFDWYRMAGYYMGRAGIRSGMRRRIDEDILNSE